MWNCPNSALGDLLNNTGTNLGLADVSFVGNTFFGRVGAALLSSTDFAPDNSNIAVGSAGPRRHSGPGSSPPSRKGVNANDV